MEPLLCLRRWLNDTYSDGKHTLQQQNMQHMMCAVEASLCNGALEDVGLSMQADLVIVLDLRSNQQQATKI